MSGNARTFTGNARLFGNVYFPRLIVPLSNILSECIRYGIKMILVVYPLSDGPIRNLILINPVTPLVELFRYAVHHAG
jgi:ABC-type polysaccharide/polyol phosphate export permease